LRIIVERFAVLGAIYFDHHPRLGTNKVGNISADPNLAPELQALEASGA
jgi:hypothetical protein